jgi:Aconitase X
VDSVFDFPESSRFVLLACRPHYIKGFLPALSQATCIIACMSRSVHAQAETRHLREMRDVGVEFVFDTCWCMLLDEPIVPVNPAASILTNSGKYAHDGPGLTNRQFRFGSMSDCIRAAKTGVYPSRAATQSVSLPLMGSSSSAFLAKQRRNYTPFFVATRLPCTSIRTCGLR